MKVVILAGGFGTRISEETHLKPKPLIEIGDRPILQHVMEIYAGYGFNEFIICLGYKGYMIKEYFANYHLHGTDVTFDFAPRGKRVMHNQPKKGFKVTLAETGRETLTGGRIKRIRKYIGDEPFMLTYGDGLANVDIAALAEFHRSHGKRATVTAVQPTGRFGALLLDEEQKVVSFHEKPEGDGGWISGGFFVLEPEVFELIADDSTVWEQEPLQQLAASDQLMAYKHTGFWQPMDTLRDKNYLEQLWQTGDIRWKKG